MGEKHIGDFRGFSGGPRLFVLNAAKGNIRVKKVEAPLKPLEIADYVFGPHKKVTGTQK